MEILKFDLSKLRNEEHFQFQSEFKALVETNTAATLGIDAQFHDYVPQFKDEADALDVIRKSASTEDLAEADIIRDTTFRGLSDAVKAASRHFSPEVNKAAARLQPVFDHYGNLARKPFDEETAAIKSLTTDLQTTYANDATIIGIKDWVLELIKDNNQFETIKNDRYTEEAAKTQLRMKDVRTAIDSIYSTIVKRINALIIVNGETHYTNFVKELNLRIQNYNHLIAQRKGRNAKDNNENISETE